jgi:hypothetical protein
MEHRADEEKDMRRQSIGEPRPSSEDSGGAIRGHTVNRLHELTPPSLSFGVETPRRMTPGGVRVRDNDRGAVA